MQFDKNKDGLMSTPEAASFIKNLLKSFIAVLADDVPEGTAEKVSVATAQLNTYMYSGTSFKPVLS